VKPRLVLILLAFLGAAALLLWPALAPAEPPTPSPSPKPAPSRYGVEIASPTAPRVKATTAAGKSIEVQCSLCHSSREPNPATKATDLDEFHQGLSFAHGTVGCLSCHDARDYDRLHLADGAPLPFERTMDLCGQCHGPQRRDYEHGAHGGMRGYWDLTRGGRTRNHCTDCHDPHAPAYPKVRPVFAPVQDNNPGKH
tara:strand:+ start:535 stop:1125 length:591 start_codon:yes stop_codon:yes gene_type:complete